MHLSTSRLNAMESLHAYRLSTVVKIISVCTYEFPPSESLMSMVNGWFRKGTCLVFSFVSLLNLNKSKRHFRCAMCRSFNSFVGCLGEGKRMQKWDDPIMAEYTI